MSNEQDEIDKVIDNLLVQHTNYVVHNQPIPFNRVKSEAKQAITTLLELQYKKGIEYGELIQLNKTNGVIYNGITYRKGDLAALEGDK